MAAGGWLKAGVGAHKVFKWWRQNEIGKLILGKQTTEETSERLQYEVTEDRGMKIDIGTRTSTNALVGGGIFSQIYIQIVMMIPGENAIEQLLLTPEAVAFAAVLFATLVARISKTPDKPGTI